MTLIFVGLGIHGAKGISLLGLEAIRFADRAYIEAYTSPIPNELIQELGSLAVRPLKSVSREFIEDGRTLIEESKSMHVALISPGDPMVATTHMDLRVRAEEKNIKTKVIHASSILSSIQGETGLHAYSFGKTVTMTKSNPSSTATVYHTLYDNLVRNLHTALLLEYDHASRSYLSPGDAMTSLLNAEADYKLNCFTEETSLMVAARVGSADQMVKGGKIRSMVSADYGLPPHIVVVPGRLHFTEVEALKVLIDGGSVVGDNSSKVCRLSEKMVSNYLARARSALKKAVLKNKAEEKKDLDLLFENVGLYLDDAERFKNEGRSELSILSVGYAEGLLDALRFIDRLEVEW